MTTVADGRLQKIIDDVMTIRRMARESVGFDLFVAPRFIESIVRKICDLSETEYSMPWDGETQDGKKVEIKLSVLKPYRSGGKRFAWQKLKGYNGKTKKVDVFVLVGYDSRKEDFPLVFLVIPSSVMGNRKWIQYLIDPVNKNRSPKWSEFVVPVTKLKRAVELAVEWNDIWKVSDATI